MGHLPAHGKRAQAGGRISSADIDRWVVLYRLHDELARTRGTFLTWRFPASLFVLALVFAGLHLHKTCWSGWSRELGERLRCGSNPRTTLTMMVIGRPLCTLLQTGTRTANDVPNAIAQILWCSACRRCSTPWIDGLVLTRFRGMDIHGRGAAEHPIRSERQSVAKRRRAYNGIPLPENRQNEQAKPMVSSERTSQKGPASPIAPSLVATIRPQSRQQRQWRRNECAGTAINGITSPELVARTLLGGSKPPRLSTDEIPHTCRARTGGKRRRRRANSDCILLLDTRKRWGLENQEMRGLQL